MFLFSALIDIFFPFLWLVDFPTVICALCTFLFHFPDKGKWNEVIISEVTIDYSHPMDCRTIYTIQNISRKKIHAGINSSSNHPPPPLGNLGDNIKIWISGGVVCLGSLITQVCFVCMAWKFFYLGSWYEIGIDWNCLDLLKNWSCLMVKNEKESSDEVKRFFW